MTLTSTVRTYDPQVRVEVKQRMQQLLDSVTQGFGGAGDITYLAGCPAVINNTELAGELVTALQSWRGVESCYLANSPVGPSEDFAFYLDYAPGVYGFLGIGDKPMCHHPEYDFDDGVIGQGIDWWLNVTYARAEYRR